MIGRRRNRTVPEPTRIFHSHVHADARSYAIDRLFFQRLWRLVKPYWFRPRGWGSWIVLGVMLALLGSFSIGGARMSQLTADQTNALVAKHSGLYWKLWLAFTLAGLVRFVASLLQTYLGGRLNLHWRKWLTLHLIDRYLEHRTYYEITVDQQIDNPDQRIQEQVGPLVQAMSGLPQQLLGAVFDLGVQFYILAAISRSMLVATFIYAAFQTTLTLYIYRPTIRQNWDATVAEADLRYGLLHIRDHAETIAFYGGEDAEREHVAARTKMAIVRQITLLTYQQFILTVQQASNLFWGALPMLLIVPLYFSGKIQYGTIMQGIIAASLILQSLSTVMLYIPTLSQMAPIAVRLAEIQEKFEELGATRASSGRIPRITHELGDRIRLRDVSIDTPGGEQQLISNLSLEVAPNQHLIVVGQTGSGKSSLLRAMAGLWNRGRGVITMPPQEETFFLPQRPYMMLGSLRDQVIYPHRDHVIPDADLQAILERVGLADLADHHGGLGAERDWAKTLSLGEQQRIGFARVLVSKPHYVLLDEATSAVDLPMERQLYNLLRRSGATFVTVGHRPSLIAYHRNVLKISAGSCTLTTVDLFTDAQIDSDSDSVTDI